MFFVVDKPRLQRMIALTRDDRAREQRDHLGPWYRIEARNGRIHLSGELTEAEFSATVYEEGVLFLRITAFRRLLATFTNTPTLAIQVQRDGLHFGNVCMPLESSNMLLYVDPARAPRHHPDEESDSQKNKEPDLDNGQGTLFGPM